MWTIRLEDRKWEEGGAGEWKWNFPFLEINRKTNEEKKMNKDIKLKLPYPDSKFLLEKMGKS